MLSADTGTHTGGIIAGRNSYTCTALVTLFYNRSRATYKLATDRQWQVRVKRTTNPVHMQRNPADPSSITTHCTCTMFAQEPAQLKLQFSEMTFY